MGAPGTVLFCSKGHLVRWWDEHLFWTDEMFQEVEDSKKEGCICGSKEIIEVSHYGGINDCICLNSEIEEKGIKKTGKIDEFLVPFNYAFYKDGKPASEIYTKATRPVYYIPDNVRDGSVYNI